MRKLRCGGRGKQFHFRETALQDRYHAIPAPGHLTAEKHGWRHDGRRIRRYSVRGQRRRAFAMLRSIAVVFAMLGSLIASAAAQEPSRSECLAMANAPPRATPVSLRRLAAKTEEVAITYAGHSTYYIDTPGGVRIATDFSGAYRTGRLPDVVTMNRAHSTHYTLLPDVARRHFGDHAAIALFRGAADASLHDTARRLHAPDRPAVRDRCADRAKPDDFPGGAAEHADGYHSRRGLRLPGNGAPQPDLVFGFLVRGRDQAGQGGEIQRS